MSDLSALQQVVTSGLRTLACATPLRLSEWAAQHFYLSAESSYVEQRWECYPYQTAIMDCMSHDEIEEVTLMKSARVGCTKIMLAAIGYFAEHKRRNQALWQPTDEDSDEFCKTEVETMMRDVPIMATVFPSFLQRHKDNTLKQKKFLGSMLHLRGGKAAKNYRRISVDVAFIDEADGFDQDVEKEGSPAELARKRIEGATFPKLIIGSTPKLRGFSIIESRFDQATAQFYFHIPCPHCNTEHALEFGGKDKPHGLKWTDNDCETAAYLCPHCGSLYTQAEYLSVWKRGRWMTASGLWIDAGCIFRDSDGNRIATPRHVGMHIWTAYSPMAQWSQIARAFLSAKAKAKAGDKNELKTFVNTTLGETWEEEVEKADEHALMARAESYRLRTVPLGGLVVSAGVDVQDNRFEICSWAWGRGEEMWIIDYTVMEANPADERDWEKLADYLKIKYEHAAGGSLGIEAVAIDTGGHFTHQTYAFARVHSSRRIYAIRGEPKQGCPVKRKSSSQDINWRGRIIKAGVKLWHVGTDTAKDLLFGRLKVTQPGPGYVHFSKDLPPEFYHQLTAEHRVLQRTAQGEQHRWVKARPRNEVLDCTVYAIFAAHMLDLHRYTERMWAKLEAAVQPLVADIFSQPLQPAEKVTAAASGSESLDKAIAKSSMQVQTPVAKLVSRPVAPQNKFARKEL